MTFHQVYYGNCLDILKKLEKDSIHLVVTSPPYYNAREYSKYETYQEYLDFMNEVISLLPRILVDGGYFCLNSTSYTEKKILYPIPFDLLNICTSHGLNLVWDVIWQKPKYTQALWRSSDYNYRKPYPFNFYLNCFHEYVWICRLGNKNRIATEDLLEASKVIGEKIEIKGKIKDEKVLKYSYREWEMEVAKPSKEKHSAAYPIELPIYCIELFSLKNDVILDPFLGTGTTSKAAMLLGRNSVGIELTKDYFRLIQEKLIPDQKDISLYHNDKDLAESGLKQHTIQFKNVDFFTPTKYNIFLKDGKSHKQEKIKKDESNKRKNLNRRNQAKIDTFQKI